MRKLLILLIVLGFTATGVYAESKCIRLGWKGGAAGSNSKWVNGQFTADGKIGSIKYDWKNGVMSGTYDAKTHVFSGTWVQDGSSGGDFSFKIPSEKVKQVNGWWTSKGETKKNALAVSACPK